MMRLPGEISILTCDLPHRSFNVHANRFSESLLVFNFKDAEDQIQKTKEPTFKINSYRCYHPFSTPHENYLISLSHDYPRIGIFEL